MSDAPAPPPSPPNDVPPADAYQYCPRCGRPADAAGVNPFACGGCGQRVFFGPTAAVAGIVCDPAGRVLFLKRAKDPGKGKWGLPGGFIDAGETAEDALKREVLEEVALEVTAARFLTSGPNTYAHGGLVIPVLDLFFVCETAGVGDAAAADPAEVAGFEFLPPTPAVLADMAFESNRRAVALFADRRADHSGGPH